MTIFEIIFVLNSILIDLKQPNTSYQQLMEYKREIDVIVELINSGELELN